MRWIFILIVIGIFFWLANLRVLVLSRDWPLILVIFGIFSILGLFVGSKKRNIIRELEQGQISVNEAERRLKKNH
jgi:hypothetical protein